MEIKVINTEEQYKRALKEVDRLIGLDPLPGTEEADQLELISKLMELYEKEHFRLDLPDPIGAIRFRMEEQGLMQKDLTPYIGSKSKVSEVLSGKRPLTIQMIRALHKGLGIPAEVLLREISEDRGEQCNVTDWQAFPLEEMVKRGWITTRVRNVRNHADELMRTFLEPLGGEIPTAAICRRTIHKRSKGEMDIHALLAWTARVLIRANEECCASEYDAGILTKEFLREVARLSLYDQGPLLAKEFLAKSGIALIIEPNLPQTWLDGGSMITSEGRPVIGVTTRHDRIDNFWYTLMHELVHVAKHLRDHNDAFIDDLDAEDKVDPREKEADRIAREAFIPRSVWVRSDAYLKRSEQAVIDLARKLRLHPAIVAGRIRWDTRNYSLFTHLVGQGKVRNLFTDREI
jgi:HTH-type transcriptional regulator / antitoxin HigA